MTAVSIPESAIEFLSKKRRRLNEAFEQLEMGEINYEKLRRAGLTRQEVERLGNYDDAGILTDMLNGQWNAYYSLMRVCFDPAEVEKLFFDTLK